MSAVHICYVLIVVLAIIREDHEVNGQLTAGGANVCSRSVSYNTYESRRYTRVGYNNYRTCCRRIFGACIKRCTRYRTYQATYYKSILIVRYKPSYYCCPGWSRSGSTCPLPICSGGCGNGKCVRPNKCQCHKGFQGRNCQIDINECTSSPCQHDCNNVPGSFVCSCRRGFRKISSTPTDGKCADVNECKTEPCKCVSGNSGCQASCYNTPGSFSCLCSLGFKLLSNGKVCSDINECSNPSWNKCQHTCFNKIGSYGCGCRSGYQLADDKRKCSDIDECKRLNGGCMQICRNTIGTFSCGCKRGFLLASDKKTCNDINECLKKPCDPKYGICKNTRGSFKCECKLGYRLLGDKKTCEDIDECLSLKPCQHNCLNQIGSYKCSCRHGYKLDPDGKRCSDVNECYLKTDNCQHGCHNKLGSFSCTCRPGYRLADNGFSCIPLPCESIKPPINGNMTCSGYTTGSTCLFSCNVGYNKKGATSRQCQPDSQWSGDSTSCTAKRCPPVTVPLHGSVVTPCTELFGSTCFKRCSRDYYMEGERKVRCGIQGNKTVWLPNNAVCKANTPCMPSPCLHSGRCSVVKNKFVCDCSNTGYIGMRCDQGIIQLSGYPQLTVDTESEAIKLIAKPTSYIEVVPFIDDSVAAVFKPASIIIRSDENVGYFTITAKKPGAIKIKYDIRGADAISFQVPKQTILYATLSRQPTEPVIVNKILTDTCYPKLQPSACQGAAEVSINSSCTWSLGSHGYITVGNNNFKFPLSLNGIRSSTFTNIYVTKLLSAKEETTDFLKRRKTNSTCFSCNILQYDSNAINYIIDNNYFQFIALKAISSRWPFWFNIRPGSGPIMSLENLISYFGNGEHIAKQSACSQLPLSPSKSYVAYQPRMPMKLNFLSLEKDFRQSRDPYCFAVDLCEDKTYLSLPKSISLDLSSSFEKAGLVGYRLKISQLALLNDNSCMKYKRLVDVGCIKTKMMMKINGRFSTQSAKFILNGSAYLDGKSFNGIMLRKLDARHRMAYTGDLDYNIDIKIGGKHLTISGNNTYTEMYFDIGHPDQSCPACMNKGILTKIDVTSHSIKYDTSIVRILPDSMLSIYIPFDMSGGAVIGLNKLPRLKLKLRQFEGITSLLNRVKEQIKGCHPQHEKIVSYHSQILERSVKNFSAHLNIDTMEFDKLAVELDIIKNVLFDMKAALKSLTKALDYSSELTSTIRRILFGIQQMEDLEVSYITNKMNIIDQGIFVKYSGQFCFYNLCLEDAHVSIQDTFDAKGCSNFDKGSNNEDVYIKVTPTKTSILSKRLTVSPQHSMRLYFDKKANKVRGYMNVTVNLLEKDHNIELVINDSLIYFATQVTMNTGFTFTVKNSVSAYVASWSNLVYRIEGEIHDMTALLTEAQMYYKVNAEKTKSKQKTVAHNFEKLKTKYEEKKEKLEALNILIKNASRNHARAVAKHREFLITLSSKQSLLKSYLENNSTLKDLIERDINKICTFKTCTQKCVQVPVCDVCQERVFENIESLKCDERVQTIRTSIVVPFDTQCPVTHYKFIPIYTGTCPVNPSVQNKQQADLTFAGIAIGFAVGGPIGGLIGALGGLFSSCDKSYEVLTQKTVVEEKCTLTRNDLQTVQRPISDCYYVTNAMQTGYNAPKRCRCKNNRCVAKITSPQCVQFNTECEKNRNLFYSQSKEIPPYFTELQVSIQKLQRNVDIALVDIEKEKKNKIFYSNQYKVAKNLLKNTERDFQFATKSKEAIKTLLTKEICLMEMYDSSSNLSNSISIKSIKFVAQLPIVGSIRLNVEVVDRKYRDSIMIPFLYDMNDRRLSIKSCAKNIVNKILCGTDTNSKRKRRSLDGSQSNEDENHLFNSWYFGKEKGVSSMQKACVTLRNVINFLNATITILINSTNEAIIVDENIKNNGIVSSEFSPSKENSVLEAQNELVESLKSNIELAKETVVMRNVLSEVREQLEVYVSGDTNKSCLNYKDCMDTAFETLTNLPTVLRTSRRDYEVAVKHTYGKLQKILSYRKGDLKSFLHMIKSFRRKVRHIESLCLHCASKPRVTSLNPSSVNVMSGKSFVLKCLVESSLSVRTYWLKDNEIIDAAQSRNLEFPSISKQDSGFYKCLAVSLVGNMTSNGTLIVVYTKPYFVSPPSNVTYLLPSYTERAVIVCNATGEPIKPTIKWFYRPFTSLQPQVLPDENATALYIEQPDSSKAGFYHCVANENEYGELRSDEVRLDILKTSLAFQKISATIKADTQNIPSTYFSDLANKMKINKALKVFIRYDVKENNSNISITILSNPNLLVENVSKLSMLNAADRSRQDLAKSASIFIAKIANGTIEIDDQTVINVKRNSLTYEYKLNMCQPGYQMDTDGYTCVQCPTGTYSVFGGTCQPCPHGTYQSKVQQMKCLRCPANTMTANSGSTSKNDCININSFCDHRRPGYYRHPTSCSKYIACNGTTTIAKCQPGLFYDYMTYRCRWLFEVSYKWYLKYLKEWWDKCEW